MPEPTTLLVFGAAALALLVVPGPAVLYIVGRGIHQGRRAALVSVLGVHAATLVHVAGAAIGLSAILASSATAFAVVKLAGAVYLVYLALRTWFSSDDASAGSGSPVPAGMRRVFGQGLLVELLNPKTALFFLAFLPQFVDLERGAPPLQIAILGLVFVCLGLLSDGAYAIASGSVGALLRRRPAVAMFQRRLSAAIYAVLGVSTAMSGERG